MTVNYSFAGRDRRLLLIETGNWLIVLNHTSALTDESSPEPPKPVSQPTSSLAPNQTQTGK